VPVENATLLFTALRAAGVPAALHIFESGGHGFGLRGLDNDQRAAWPSMAMDWGRAHGVFWRVK
jgi:dipeptidyl aminopeptidase/acylaminoacyl peptidase